MGRFWANAMLVIARFPFRRSGAVRRAIRWRNGEAVRWFARLLHRIRLLSFRSAGRRRGGARSGDGRWVWSSVDTTHDTDTRRHDTVRPGRVAQCSRADARYFRATKKAVRSARLLLSISYLMGWGAFKCKIAIFAKMDTSFADGGAPGGHPTAPDIAKSAFADSGRGQRETADERGRARRPDDG